MVPQLGIGTQAFSPLCVFFLSTNQIGQCHKWCICIWNSESTGKLHLGLHSKLHNHITPEEQRVPRVHIQLLVLVSLALYYICLTSSSRSPSAILSPGLLWSKAAGHPVVLFSSHPMLMMVQLLDSQAIHSLLHSCKDPRVAFCDLRPKYSKISWQLSPGLFWIHSLQRRQGTLSLLKKTFRRPSLLPCLQ